MSDLQYFELSGVVSLTPTERPEPEPEPPVRELKSPLTGLIARQANSQTCPMDRISDLGGSVAEVRWGDSQPTQGFVLRDPEDPLNTEWAMVQYARKTGKPYRLRGYAGVHAPTWAKTLCGRYRSGDDRNMLHVYSTSAGDNTIGRWWYLLYLMAWQEWVMQLAEHFEDDPLCVSIASHPATTTYAEPMQRATAGGAPEIAGNRQVFIDAGLSGVLLDESAKPWQPDPDDATAVAWPVLPVGGRARFSYWFPTTHYFLPFNPFQQWESTVDGADAGPVAMVDFTTWLIGEAVKLMGGQIELGNNSLRAPVGGGDYATMYELMNTVAGGKAVTAIQTASMQQMMAAYPAGGTDGDALAATLDIAFGFTTPDNDPQNFLRGLSTPFHTRSVELPNGWQKARKTDGTLALDAAACAVYNEAAAEQPDGTTIAA